MIEISAQDYSARIDREGAALRSVTFRGRELTVRVDAPVPTPPYAGLVLAPWPNRIADGRYDFAGRSHQLPINEVERNTALHGLVLWERWQVSQVAADHLTLTCEPAPRPGYPYRIALAITYRVDADGMSLELEATNAGTDPAPIGLATHPYFTTGSTSALDQWTLTLPCTEVIDTDERLLPITQRPVQDLGLDFVGGRVVGPTVLDHAFGGVRFDPDGVTWCQLTDEDGLGVRLRWDTRCPWLQVYTMHAPGAPLHRRAVALEPMTCAPDAFNSGVGLRVLAGSETASMGWRVSAVGG